MKQLIGNHRFLYNKGVNYFLSLPRGYYLPKKGDTNPKNYILYEGEYIRVETDGKYAYGLIPAYDEITGKRKNQTDFKAVRSYLNSILPEWFKSGGFPTHSVDQAAREVADKYEQIRALRQKDKKKFHMYYKSKKRSVIQTIPMEASSLNKKGFVYSRLFKHLDSKLYMKEPIDIKNNKSEYKISYNRNNFDFHVSFVVNKKVIDVPNRKQWCSIDPGDLIFATIYDTFSRNVMLVANSEGRKSFNDSTISKLQRKISKNKSKKKKFNRALQNAREKDKNKRSDLHQRLATYLCSNFKHIIVPQYGIKNMTLNSTVNKSMRNLGFYQFLCFLKHKCTEYNTKLYIVEEHYTTQACCRCGTLNQPDDRDYKCKKCKVEIHRDVNGAINIGLKHLQSKSK